MPSHRRISSTTTLALFLGLVAIGPSASCGGGGNANSDGTADSDGDSGGGSGDNGSSTGGAAVLGQSGSGQSGGTSAGAAGGSTATGGGAMTCAIADAACETSEDCCNELTCGTDGGSTLHCIDESVCKATGSECDAAFECCSLSCNGTCQSGGSLCLPSGESCADNTECCSNDCQTTCQSVGTGCSSLGETCSAEGYDAGCCSKYCENLGTASAPALRCSRASACGARGDICAFADDCCSGVCLDGRCPTQDEVNGQLFAGEPCSKDSDCASYACASSTPDAPKTCQFLGGCRPAGEICTAAWQCCSALDLHNGQQGAFCSEEIGTPGADAGVGCEAHASVAGLSVCGLNNDDKETGEICKDTDGADVHNCCPIENCELTASGVSRCGGADGFSEETCRGDGEACQAPDQCCTGICSPVDVGGGVIELQCGASCVLTGNLCTSNADCCGGICTNGSCGEGTSACVPLTGGCTADEDCCSGYCSGGRCSTVTILT